MQNLKILNKKESKKIVEKIKIHFGISDLDLDYGFLMNNEGKLFFVSKDISKLDLEKLRINTIGLYFGTFNNEIRLSIEGSQLVGSKATRNIIELSKEQMLEWLKGKDIDIKSDLNDFVIVKHKNDFLGCGKLKNSRLLNYVPKNRRIKMGYK